jgi:hypothetical protein
MLLQTLRTRDFEELAGAFPRWKLRFRQFGRVFLDSTRRRAFGRSIPCDVMAASVLLL